MWDDEHNHWWFTYSDNTIDGQSRKKAYTLWESNLVADKDVGKVKALQQIHAYLFGGQYDFAGKIRPKTTRITMSWRNSGRHTIGKDLARCRHTLAIL